MHNHTYIDLRQNATSTSHRQDATRKRHDVMMQHLQVAGTLVLLAKPQAGCTCADGAAQLV